MPLFDKGAKVDGVAEAFSDSDQRHKVALVQRQVELLFRRAEVVVPYKDLRTHEAVAIDLVLLGDEGVLYRAFKVEGELDPLLLCGGKHSTVGVEKMLRLSGIKQAVVRNTRNDPSDVPLLAGIYKIHRVVGGVGALRVKINGQPVPRIGIDEPVIKILVFLA